MKAINVMVSDEAKEVAIKYQNDRGIKRHDDAINNLLLEWENEHNGKDGELKQLEQLETKLDYETITHKEAEKLLELRLKYPPYTMKSEVKS